MSSRSHHPLAGPSVARQFPSASGVEYEIKAFIFSLIFYGLFAATAFGLSPWILIGVGPFLVIRSYNALHETFHLRKTHYAPLHWLPIVVGPWQLGYDEFRRSHLSHHSHEGKDGDVEGYLVRGSLVQAAFHAFTQPEQALFRYVKQYGLSPRGRIAVLANACLFAGVLWLGWGEAALAYVIATRVGNTFTWLVFHWVLHHPQLVDGFEPLSLPRWFRLSWWLTLGPDSLFGSTHHSLHHLYPAVPDGSLPTLLAVAHAAQRTGGNAGAPQQRSEP